MAGCRRVIRAGEQAGARLNISFGFQQRYGPDYLAAKALLDSGTLGKIRGVHAQFIKGAITGREPVPPAPQSERDRIRQWTIWRALHGDIIVETHCHNIDVLNWFMGAHPSKAVGTAGRTIERRGDISDHVNVTFDYPGNVQATFVGSQVAPPYYRTNNERFLCEKGVVETAREYWAKYLTKTPVTETAPHDITEDALADFIRRVAAGKVENTAARSAESTMTAILARMACDARREVRWEELARV
jgi:myo-inositol 2-dehydrogenase / D-chiro-inositol 1-dehydrogenase